MAIAMVRKRNNLLGIGLYSVPEAARLLREPTRKVRRWIDGYTFHIGSSLHASEAVVRRELPELRQAEVLTFLDLMELFFVAMFRNHGVSLPIIRKSAEVASQLFHADHPFAVKRFDTDGKSIFATMRDEAEAEGRLQELYKMQYVFVEQAEPFFKKLDYDVDAALRNAVHRYWPLGKAQCVVLDPKRAFGKPIDNESGIPTSALYAVILGGETPRSVADWYGISVATVKCAVKYETSLVQK